MSGNGKQAVRPEKNEQHPVSYEALIRAEVKVMDEAGNLYYLEPARRQGEFVLRTVPTARKE